MRKLHNNYGFTLMEVLISIIIILIGIFAVMGLAIIVIKGNLHSDRVTTATTMAQSLIEEATNAGYDAGATMTAIFGPTGNADDLPTSGTSSSWILKRDGDIITMDTMFDSNDYSGVNYFFYMDIQTDTAVTNLENVAYITVDVSWGSGSSNTVHKNVELRTIIAQ